MTPHTPTLTLISLRVFVLSIFYSRFRSDAKFRVLSMITNGMAAINLMKSMLRNQTLIEIQFCDLPSHETAVSFLFSYPSHSHRSPLTSLFVCFDFLALPEQYFATQN